MESILVTVIIPVYNTEKYIEDCMKSVLGQSHVNLEVILINDGSTDNSAQLCRRFTYDPRVILVDRENWGLSRTRQQGIDMAKGEYFCNLDSDDMLDTQFVEKMLRCAGETGADIVTCGRKDFDDGYEKDFLLTADKPFYPLDMETVSNQFDIISTQLWLADSWNKLYRTDFVRKTEVRYWLNNKYNGTDLSFNHLLCLHCPRIAVLNEPILLHRIVTGSRVHRKNKPLQEGFQMIAERQLREAELLGYKVAFYKRYRYSYYVFLSMAFHAIISECETRKELKKRWRDYRDSMEEFAARYPIFEPCKLGEKPCEGFDRIIQKAMLSPNMFWCMVVYRIYRLRQWKNGKRGSHV